MSEIGKEKETGPCYPSKGLTLEAPLIEPAVTRWKMSKPCPCCGKEIVKPGNVVFCSSTRCIGEKGQSWEIEWTAKPFVCFDCKIKIGNGIRAALSGDIKYLGRPNGNER